MDVRVYIDIIYTAGVVCVRERHQGMICWYIRDVLVPCAWTKPQ